MIPVEPTAEHPMPFDLSDEEPKTHKDAVAVAINTADLVKSLGGDIHFDNNDLHKAADLIAGQDKPNKPKHVAVLAEAAAAKANTELQAALTDKSNTIKENSIIQKKSVLEVKKEKNNLYDFLQTNYPMLINKFKSYSIKEKNLPFLNYGNSDLLKIGEWVLAVGNPFNLNSTVTAGIISAKGRNNILNGNNKPIESFIQTDAAVNPGNSGGALVNTDGELIGINTAIASNNGAFQGYSFAVPVNIVRKVVSDLVEFGTVQRAYIGISIQDINAKFAEEKKLKQLNGVYINGVTEGGSAEESGMNEGDIITKIQDVPVTSVSELQEQLSKYRPGDKITVTIDRKDSQKDLALVLKSADNTTRLIKKSENASSPVASLGATFSEVDNNQLAAIGLQNGVKVSKIVAGKISLMGIQEGFIITSINRMNESTTIGVSRMNNRN